MPSEGGYLLDRNITSTASVEDTRVPWYKKSQAQKWIFLTVVLGPAFACYFAFSLYPNILTAYYSFFRWDGIGPKIFIGLRNYAKMITDPFLYKALLNNLILASACPLLVIMISVILAYLLVTRRYKEAGFYKVLFFLPNVLSSVVVALLWTFIYNGQWGLLNKVLELIGIDMGGFYWLGSERTALLAIIPLYVWSGVGFYVIVFMNAINSIPPSLYESAILEGAGNMQRLFKITLPLISGVIRVGIIFMVLGSFKGFETILIMTNGGPYSSTNVIGLYMFNFAFSSTEIGGFNQHDFGYASTIGMFLFVVLVGANLIVNKFFKHEAVEF